MKSLLILFSVLVMQIVSAQEEVYANGVFGFEENKPQKIFTDFTRVTIDKKDKEFNQNYKQNIASIKAVQENTLIDEVSFDTGSGESLSYGTFNIESNHKLKNVDFTLKAMVSGEACGIASYDQYVLFKNKKLIALPQLMNVGDADVYYHSEEFIFPNDKGGIPNAFIFKMEEMEKDEEEREKKKNVSKTYLWNGDSYRLK